MSNIKTKDINFYTQFKEPVENKGSSRNLLLIIILLVVILLAGVIVGLYVRNGILKNNISDLNTKIQDPALTQKIQQSQKYKDDADSINNVLMAYQANDDVINAQSVEKNRITDNLVSTIVSLETNEVSVNSMSYSDATVTLDITAENENEVASYVERLRQTDLFNWIDYVGYSGSDGQFSSTVTATFEVETTTAIAEGGAQ